MTRARLKTSNTLSQSIMENIDMNTRAKKPSKYLVAVGTYIPTTTKLGLQALAESQNKSIYEYLQELIESTVAEFENSIEGFKHRDTPPPSPDEDDGADLLA